MNANTIFRYRFGLAAFTLASSLLSPASTFAQTAGTTKPGTQPTSGPQQVVVTNTTAQPVPVSTPSREYFQARKDVDCSNVQEVDATFSIPAGKMLVLQTISVSADGLAPGQTFSATLTPFDQSTTFSIPMTSSGGFSTNHWIGLHSLLMVATQTLNAGLISNVTAPSCAGTIAISGELIPAS